MACPKCGCKTTYTYDEGDDMQGGDEHLDRCAACGEVFDVDDHADEDEGDLFHCDECPSCGHNKTPNAIVSGLPHEGD